MQRSVRPPEAPSEGGRRALKVQGPLYFSLTGVLAASTATLAAAAIPIFALSLDEFVLPAGRLAPAEARRNVVTRGIDLNALAGTRFYIGTVECIGRRLCEPCAHLQRLTQPGALRGLVHRGGLRVDVLSDGIIRVGDSVEAI